MSSNSDNEDSVIDELALQLSSLDIGYENEAPLDRDLRRAYFAARDGQAIMLYAILKDQSPSDLQYILKQPYHDTPRQHFCPLIVIGARNGHDKVVMTLMHKVCTMRSVKIWQFSYDLLDLTYIMYM